MTRTIRRQCKSHCSPVRPKNEQNGQEHQETNAQWDVNILHRNKHLACLLSHPVRVNDAAVPSVFLAVLMFCFKKFDPHFTQQHFRNPAFCWNPFSTHIGFYTAFNFLSLRKAHKPQWNQKCNPRSEIVEQEEKGGSGIKVHFHWISHAPEKHHTQKHTVHIRSSFSTLKAENPSSKR